MSSVGGLRQCSISILGDISSTVKVMPTLRVLSLCKELNILHSTDDILPQY